MRLLSLQLFVFAVFYGFSTYVIAQPAGHEAYKAAQLGSMTGGNRGSLSNGPNRGGVTDGAMDPALIEKIKKTKINVKDQKLQSSKPKKRQQGLLLAQDDPYQVDPNVFRSTYLLEPPQDFKPGFKFIDTMGQGIFVKLLGLVQEKVRPEQVLLKDKVVAGGYRFAAEVSQPTHVIAHYNVPIKSDDLNFVPFFLGLELKGQKFNKIKLKVAEREWQGWKAQLTLKNRQQLEMLALQVEPNVFIYRIGRENDAAKKSFDAFLVAWAQQKNGSSDSELVEYLITHPGREAHASVPDSCRIPKLPKELEVHVLAIKQGGKQLGVQIDPEYKTTAEESVGVGFSDDPVFLVLSSATPTLWRFRATQSARIAGILLTGKGRQVLVDMPENVPIYYSPKLEEKKEGHPECPRMFVDGVKDRVGALKMGDNLAGMLGDRDIDSVQLRRAKGLFEVGKIDADLPKLREYDPVAFSVTTRVGK